MGFSVSTPSYMYQSPSGYIFRLRIPTDLRPLVGKCEFRYSLRTGASRVARHRARYIASYIQQLFIRARANMAEVPKDNDSGYSMAKGSRATPKGSFLNFSDEFGGGAAGHNIILH
jgi:hypothetical protein